jgi:NADPH-dependent 2,4-dienoyl-CoA reductase/sulfur reductase-like enzyme
MRNYECVVIGAGPAGLGAAIEARKHGVRVLVVDENHLPGGQLFKQIHKFFGSKEHMAGTRGFIIGQKLLREAEELGVEVWLKTRAWGLFPENVVALVKDGVAVRIKADKIIIATGATENALAFAGCTLPGVITAGAAQTMINVNRVLPGKKILMVGTGNVGLIVSYQLMQAGADIVAIVEAGAKVGGYDVHANKIRKAGVPFYLSHTVIKAQGKDGVEKAIICPVDGCFKPLAQGHISLEVDTICLAVGLAPRIELLHMTNSQFSYAGALGGHLPLHDDFMAVDKDMFVAGDVSGVEEASTALEEGRLAGLAVAHKLNTIEETEFIAEYQMIENRLKKLRSGTFGEKRAIAKAQIIGEAKKSC